MSGKQVQCPNGHTFDRGENIRCPYCPIPGIELDTMASRSRPPSPSPRPGAPAFSPLRSPAPAPAGAAPRPGRTIAIWPGQSAPGQPTERGPHGHADATGRSLDPVVGWLVAVEGPARGRDFRIRWGNNTIGRDPGQDICLSEDGEVSRERHAVVTYDPVNNKFLLQAGAVKGLVYVRGGTLVTGAEALDPYTVIQIGGSKLVFVPLCGEFFEWQLAGKANDAGPVKL